MQNHEAFLTAPPGGTNGIDSAPVVSGAGHLSMGFHPDCGLESLSGGAITLCQEATTALMAEER